MPSFVDEDARVRRWLAWKITIIQKAVDKDFTNEYLIPAFHDLLNENDVTVRKAARSSVDGVIKLMDTEILVARFCHMVETMKDSKFNPLNI